MAIRQNTRAAPAPSARVSVPESIVRAAVDRTTVEVEPAEAARPHSDSLLRSFMDAITIVATVRSALLEHEEAAEQRTALSVAVESLYQLHSELDHDFRAQSLRASPILERYPAPTDFLQGDLESHLEVQQRRAGELQELLELLARHDDQQAGILTMTARAAEEINGALDAEALRRMLGRQEGRP